jgi:hypothetical protein
MEVIFHIFKILKFSLLVRADGRAGGWRLQNLQKRVFSFRLSVPLLTLPSGQSTSRQGRVNRKRVFYFRLSVPLLTLPWGKNASHQGGVNIKS